MNSLRITILLFLCVCIALQTLSAQVFVKETATGAATGVDWDNALGGGASLKTAIEAGGIVYISEGAFTPPSLMNLNLHVSFFVQGGFPSSATGTDLSGYDPVAYPTVIDGGSTIQIFDNNTQVDTIHLTGLTLQNASGIDGSAFQSDFNNSSEIDYRFTDLIVQNCVSSGLGAFSVESKTNTNSEIFFSNCTFLNNTATNGGAIHMQTVYNDPNGATAIPGNLVINNCQFEGNSSNAIGGGALYFRTTNAWIIKNTDFCTNEGMNARGGAIYFRTSGSNVIDSCFFSNNTSNEFGGAIDASSSTSATISNSMFVGNSSTISGGAISASVSSWDLDNTHFYNNIASNGGAISSTSWHAGVLRSTTNNCMFYENEALGAGPTSGSSGSGALLFAGTASFPNGWDIDSCTFVNNKANASSWGGAISHGGMIETSKC